MTAAILLAAGAGRRFEGATHKLLADAGGAPLIVKALENITASRLAPVAIVAGAVDLSELLPPGVVQVMNPDWASGQSTSLQAGVRWAISVGADAVVIGLGDQPRVSADAWRRVAACTDTPIAVATYGGRRGHPVRLHSSVWPRLPVAGDVGARVVMTESPELVTEVACDGDPSDVDTLEDLEVEQVATLLGRRPQGRFVVVVRSPAGTPVVIRNHPVLDDGTPMPTLYWLTGAAESAAVGRLESRGGVKAAAAAVSSASVSDAHRRYAAERDALLPADYEGRRPSGGVGGTRQGVKCLHADYAWFLAGGDDPVGRWVAAQLASDS